MAELRPELESATIVAVGGFNPSIFQPAWLSSNGLIRKEESEAAKITVIHRELSVFTVGSITLEVTGDRFQAQTTDPSCYEPLRDLVVSVFAILEHTPFDKLGINRLMHFRMPTESLWHQLGHLLVPKELWAGIVQTPGTRSVVVQSTRGGSPAKRFHARVEPSTRVHPGVFFETNEHFEVAPGEHAARDLLKMLREHWSTGLAFSLASARKIIRNVVKEE